MNKIKKLSLISLLLMTAFSFSGFFKIEINGEPLKLVNFTLVIGIIVFFITREPEDKDAMSLKAIPQLSKILPFGAALPITAVLFSLCHLASGSTVVVLYDLLFIVINAVFYGLVYKRTNNILISTLSHFLANLLGVLALLVI